MQLTECVLGSSLSFSLFWFLVDDQSVVTYSSLAWSDRLQVTKPPENKRRCEATIPENTFTKITNAEHHLICWYHSMFRRLNNLFNINDVYPNHNVSHFSQPWSRCISHSSSLFVNINDRRMSIISLSFKRWNPFFSCPRLCLHPPAATQLMFSQACAGY